MAARCPTRFELEVESGAFRGAASVDRPPPAVLAAVLKSTGASEPPRPREGATDAAAIWRGLQAGRWSLVERVDVAGKCFVVAVEKPPAPRRAVALTPRQRAACGLAVLGQSNKEIGYALGISTAAATMLLGRARAAFGARTRVELILRCSFTGMKSSCW